jgi:hypothetical protein
MGDWLPSLTEMDDEPPLSVSVPELNILDGKYDILEAEVEALSSIYSAEEVVVVDIPPIMKHLRKRITVNLPNDVSCTLVIPYAYPEVSPCILKSTYTWFQQRIEEYLIKNFIPGNEVLLSLLQLMWEIAEEINNDTNVNANQSQGLEDNNQEANDKYATEESELLSNNNGYGSIFKLGEDGVEMSDISASASASSIVVNVIKGNPLIEKKSVFVGHVASINSMEELNAFRNIVFSDRKVREATHNIQAYRFTEASTGVINHDCDDDGESAAGGRLAEMLRLMKVENIAIIVTRWFGGVKLGPDRFKLINNCARSVLEKSGLIQKGVSNSNTGKKLAGK